MNIRFSVSGRTVQDGVTTPGTVHVSEPAVPVRCLFRGPYDVLHLHVPNNLLAECGRDMPGHPVPVLCSKSVLSKDITVDSLGRALLEADRVGGSFGQLYADCIGIAIVVRLLTPANRPAALERPKAGGLARWRLKRAIDYVEARLDKPLSLADVASSAGLTRMHFAAQFRAATGLRPTNTFCAAESNAPKRCSWEPTCRWWMSRYRSDFNRNLISPAFSNATRDSHRARGVKPEMSSAHSPDNNGISRCRRSARPQEQSHLSAVR